MDNQCKLGLTDNGGLKNDGGKITIGPGTHHLETKS